MRSLTQVVLLPEVLDDYVTADNPVRFLDAFVAQLDLGGAIAQELLDISGRTASQSNPDDFRRVA